METRSFGKIHNAVSVLSFGAGHIGRKDVDANHAAKLLNLALDSGINLIDTARGYGLSEERIGSAIANRRSEYILVTKGGYSVDGAENWSPDAIRISLEESLRRLKCDTVDLFLLHSCDMEILTRDETLRTLEEAQKSGLCRFFGYSGENEELDWALDSGHFSAVETSVNICDQGNLYGRLEGAQRRNMAVIAKRPLANVFWRYEERPVGEYADAYWVRWQKMKELGIPELEKLDDHSSMLRAAWGFTASAKGVSTAIAGTSSEKNLKANLKLAEKSSIIDEGLAASLKKAWEDAGRGSWKGQV